MRRIHALLIVTALTFGVARQAEAQLEIGIKGGVTFATLSETSLSPNFGSKTGFDAGVHFGIPFGKSFMLQPEALISQQGASVSGGPFSTDFKVSYLVVPVNLRFNFGSGGIQPFILGGPYAAFQLSCNLEDIGDCDDLDLGDTDYGVDFGAGLKFGGALGLFAEARYNLGLKDISDLGEGFDSKQRVFMVMVGISF